MSRKADEFRDKKTREKEAKLKILHEACRRGREDDVVKMLAEDTDRVDINARDPSSGWTALHYAALRGDVQVIRLLLDASCDVSITDSPYEQTPLHVAAKYSHAETCRQLLLANADPAVTNNARKTPLQVASSEDVKAILMASVSESDGSAQLAGIGLANVSMAGYKKKTGMYNGRLEDGVVSGDGVLQGDDGSVYTGQWKAGKRHGRGVQTEGNGEVFDGEWANDLREGHGHLQEADGGEYTGSWAANRRQGRGKQIWASGAKFDGEFYEDKIHGTGLLRYENGHVYEGNVHEGVRHGKGRMIWKEGHWYEGNWLRDRRHGEGLEQVFGHTESKVSYQHGALTSREPLAGCPYSHALIITIAYYKNKFRIPASDRQPRASAFARVLKHPLLSGYPVENVTHLADEEATRDAIMSAISRLQTVTASNATVFVYFDGAAAEISSGPDAGYYLCPFDYYATDRPGTSLTCIKGHGEHASGYMLEALKGLPAAKCFVVLNTCTPDTLDTDVTVGSPYYREKFFQKLSKIPGRAAFSSCRMDEPTYTGIMSNLIFNAFAGVREEESDIDNQFYARIASDQNSMYTFNLLDYLRRHMHSSLPKEYKDDPRMHPLLQLDGEDNNFVLARRSPPTRFPMEMDQKRAELGVEDVLRGIDHSLP